MFDSLLLYSRVLIRDTSELGKWTNDIKKKRLKGGHRFPVDMGRVGRYSVTY